MTTSLTRPPKTVYLSVKDYGAVGNGSADDTTPVQAACTAASALSPPGTVVWDRGTYLVSTALVAKCNMIDAGATILYNGTTTNPALTIGDSASGVATSHLYCEVPTIDKNAARSWGTIGTADVGLRIVNLTASILHVRYIIDFTVNLQVAGYGTGSSYNTIILGELRNGKTNIHCTSDITGWSNENTFLGGQLAHDNAIGTAVAGTRQILLDFPTGGNNPNNNRFYGQSVEGNVPEYHVESVGGTRNEFFGLRWEATTPKVYFNQVSASEYSQQNMIRGGYRADNIVFTQSANSAHNAVEPAGGKRIPDLNGFAIAGVNDGSNNNPALVTVTAGELLTGDPQNDYGFGAGMNRTDGKRKTDATSAPRWRLNNSSGELFTTTGVRLGSLTGPLVIGASAALTYSASMTPDAAATPFQKITVTNGTAMTINAPSNPANGAVLAFDILNSSGGAMGAITWNAAFKMAGAFTNPASTKRRTISFYYDGTSWVETNRAAADI